MNMGNRSPMLQLQLNKTALIKWYANWGSKQEQQTCEQSTLPKMHNATDLQSGTRSRSWRQKKLKYRQRSVRNDKWLRQNTQILTSEKGNNTPQNPTGWGPVFGSLLGNLRKTKMKLQRQSTDQTLSCGSWRERTQKHNTKKLTAIFQKVHTFLEEDNSNITRERSIANRMSCPRREEVTGWWKRWMLFISLSSSTGEVAGSQTLNREGENTHSFQLIQLEIPSASTKETWNPSSHGGAWRGFQEHITRVTQKEESGEQGGWRRDRWPLEGSRQARTGNSSPAWPAGNYRGF